jgi:hypothetical protein
MDIAHGLQAIAQAASIAKAMRAESTGSSPTIASHINDLLAAVLDAKEALLQAKEAESSLREEVERLQDAFRERQALKVGRDGYRYRVLGDGQLDGYPACPHCDQVHGRIMFLVPDQHWSRGYCPACDKRYTPIHPYNSDGEREERELDARNEAALRNAPKFY